MDRKTALFIGDSLIEFHDWQRRFPAFDLITAVRAGETAQELLRRLLVWPPKPRPHWVVIMIGANKYRHGRSLSSSTPSSSIPAFSNTGSMHRSPE